MPQRKVKIEFKDDDGGVYTISLTGGITRDKVGRVMEIVDLLSPEQQDRQRIPQTDTTFGRLYELIESKFPLGSFGSPEVLEAYEDEYSAPIRLSTISTYLQRFHDRGVLTRQKSSSSSGWSYRRSKLNTH